MNSRSLIVFNQKLNKNKAVYLKFTVGTLAAPLALLRAEIVLKGGTGSLVYSVLWPQGPKEGVKDYFPFFASHFSKWKFLLLEVIYVAIYVIHNTKYILHT